VPNISLIGSGSTAIGFLLQTLTLINSAQINEEQAGALVINIFEESSILGAGTPYDPSKTGFQLILNIRNNSGTLPQSGADFLEWLKINRKFIDDVFDKIFAQRLAEKIARNPDKEGLFRASYAAISKHFKEKYLNLDDSVKSYHPRILYGIYRVALFEQIVEALAAKGVSINLHGKSKVVDFRQNLNQEFELLIEGAHSIKTDFVLFAGGMVEKASSLMHENFIASQLPEENLRARIEKLIEDASGGKREIKIGIIGSSLSAVDAVRTIYYEKIFQGQLDFEIDDIKIKTDFISRDGRLPKVRAAFAPFDFKKDGGTFPEISALKEARELHKKSGKIHLWQILKICAEKIEIFYRYFGQEYQASRAQSFAKFIEDQKENYPAILEEFAKFEDAKGFLQLETDLQKAMSGDARGLLGYQVAYGLAAPAHPEILALLSDDDKKIYQEYFATLHNLNDSPMPAPVAQDLLELHKKGLVDIIKLCHREDELINEGDRFFIIDESGARHEYDLAIRADGYVKSLQDSCETLHEQITSIDNPKIFKFGLNLKFFNNM